MKKIIFIIIAGLAFSCRPATDKTRIINPSEEVDITYIDFSTIMAHDTATFANAEEEYQFIMEQNHLLQELLHHYDVIKDGIDAVMFDGIDEECNYSGNDILDWLYEYYEKDSQTIDSLYNTQL